MKKILFTITLFFIMQTFFANNLQITNVTKVDASTLTFDVSWENSWKTVDGEDFVYIFIKYKNNSGQWMHLNVQSVYGNVNGIIAGLDPINQIHIYHGFSGLFSNSNITATVQFNSNDVGMFPDFKVFGIEMVQSNTGPFYLGDGVSTNRFSRGDDNTQPYHVTSGATITVGNTSSDLAVLGGLNQNIPANYPNGYYGVSVMKYEATQEQYAEFLNTLTFNQQQNLTKADLTNITASNHFVMAGWDFPWYRNGIACDPASVHIGVPVHFYCDLNNNGVPNEIDDGQNIACNFVSYNVVLAYLEWARLRPMTDMEFEKINRGPALPIPNDFANGISYYVSANAQYGLTNYGMPNESVTNINTDGLLNLGADKRPMRVGAFATATSTRLQSGGSYYGVMDLSGNLYEFTVPTRNSSLSFQRNDIGSGSLDIDGNSTTWDGKFLDEVLKKGGSFYGSGYEYSISTRKYYFDNSQGYRNNVGIRGVMGY